MKWLFATLVGLNLIVFAGMIASKMLKQHMPVANPQQTTAPPTIIINGQDLITKNNAASAPASASAASGAVVAAGGGSGNAQNANKNRNQATAQNNARNNDGNKSQSSQNNNNRRENNTSSSQRERHSNNELSSNQGKSGAKYKECSARVSMPEDDYHRIKGLLTRYPHAASRQVVDNGNGESAARMNVVFMQVSDQEASAIQGVVGRYGQLNRSACNR